jgi:hypothetical protein
MMAFVRFSKNLKTTTTFWMSFLLLLRAITQNSKSSAMYFQTIRGQKNYSSKKSSAANMFSRLGPSEMQSL